MSRKLFNKVSILVINIIFLTISLLSIGYAAEKNIGERQFVVIVDNSGSMNSNDPATYSVQAAKIINNLLMQGDSLSLIRLASTSSCGSYDASIVTNGSINSDAKFDSHISNNSSGTHFSVPVSNAVKIFEKKTARQMLLIITDISAEDVLKQCKVRENLKKLRKKGVDIAFIYISKNNQNTAINNPIFSSGLASTVNSSQQLTKQVAKIYQNFIGGISPQSGDISGQQLEVNIDNYVKDAYIVVLAEGKVGSVKSTTSNPISTDANNKININYKKGSTKGSDSTTREYNIIHIQRPDAQKWEFSFPELADGAGWMLIQEYSVGIRIISAAEVAEGVPVEIKAKLYDELTKKDISIDSDMQLVMMDQQGKKVVFSKSKDNQTFIATITPKKIGELQYITHLTSTSKNIDKKKRFDFKVIKVIKGSWIIEPNIPSTTTINQVTNLTVELKSQRNSSLLTRPAKITLELAGEKLELKPNKSSNRLEYTTVWTPKNIGKVSMKFYTIVAGKTIKAIDETNVIGNASFGNPIPINFGKLKSDKNHNISKRILDLSNAKVFGNLDIKIETNYSKNNSSLQIKKNGKWLKLNDVNTLTLKQSEKNQWNIRLVVKSCPEALLPSEKFAIEAWFTKQDGTIEKTQIPMTMEIEADTWIECWWPFVLGAILSALLIWIIHCIRSPARFPSTFELLIASESDLREEGINHKILNYKGTKSGFCQDAKIYMHQDIRFTKSSKGAFIKFQARKNGVHIIVLGNGSLWYQRYGKDWEKEAMNEEVLLRTGTIYRNDHKSLFFKAKNI